ncbi:PRAME family member 3-like [Psammomys obesus]|uniref:PRAME family member 3-like n=1 Tax=Psammomys obesus TaxID=48139 RepID=UPI002452B8E1|nr:PRAME family member 3-like [Psammomys obesus]
MSCQAIPTLQQLSLQELLSDEDLAVSTLEGMPTELFPLVFKEAFIKRRRRILKSMVASWPYPCLPIGALMKSFHVDNFHAVLDGVDLLSQQKVQPKRGKLEVLDLQDAHHDFWEGTAGKKDDVSSPQIKPGEKDPTTGVNQPLKVVIEYTFKSSRLNSYNEYFMRWLLQRRQSRPPF